MLPAWLASTVQLPVLASNNVVPLTVQTVGVLDTSDTARPELALATRAGGVLPKVWLPGELKLMVCVMGATLKVLLTIGAAAKLVLPAWLAATVQVPKVTRLKVLPLTVQTAGVVEANDTTRPEDAVATRAAGATPIIWLPGAVKLMVCAANCTATEKVWTTGVAAV